MTYKDKAFCGSPNCKNECGRKMTDEEKKEVELKILWVAYTKFCDEEGIKICSDNGK